MTAPATDLKVAGQRRSQLSVTAEQLHDFMLTIAHRPPGLQVSANDVRDRLDHLRIPERARAGLFRRAVAAGLIEPVLWTLPHGSKVPSAGAVDGPVGARGDCPRVPAHGRPVPRFAAGPDVSRPPVRRCGDNGQPGCGRPIYLVLIVPTVLRHGAKRGYVPLDPTYDPACGVPPSHATSLSWDRCRPLGRGEDPAPNENPALTHFATCPLRQRATPEGTDL